MKIRLIWRRYFADADGKATATQIRTDVIDLPEDAEAFAFPDAKERGWLPELIGGEWIKEDMK